MPSVQPPKTDAISVLVEELVALSSQARTLALDFKRAQADADCDTPQIRERFRAKIRALIAKLAEKEAVFSKDYVWIKNASPGERRQEFFRQLAERAELVHSRSGLPTSPENPETEANFARDDSTSQKSAEPRSERATTGEQSKLLSRLALLQAEIAQKEQTLYRRHAAANAVARNIPTAYRQFQHIAGSDHRSLEPAAGDLRGAERNLLDLRERITHLERLKKELALQMEILQKKSHARITALQAEIARNNVLLSQSRQAPAQLERELEDAENRQSPGMQKKAGLAGDASKDLDLARTGAEVRAATEKEERLLEHRLSRLENNEIELFIRNDELQGRVAAQKSVIENLEKRLRRQAETDRGAKGQEPAEGEPTAADREAPPAKDVGLGSGRRWETGVIKRRWKAALMTRRRTDRASDFAYGF